MSHDRPNAIDPRSVFVAFSAIVTLLSTLGCAAPQYVPPIPLTHSPIKTPSNPILQANFQQNAPTPGVVERKPSAIPAGPLQVDDLVGRAIALNPRLARATFAIDAAQGRFAQAGLYPNPVLAVTADELGDRQGPGGIITAPQISQEIVTGRKLSLSQAVAAREVDQSTLGLLRERYAVIGSVRAAFYDLYALERRIGVLEELAKLAADAVTNGQALFDSKRIARLDLVQLEVESARFRSQSESAKRELPSARKRLAAAVGDPRLEIGTIAGPYDDVPKYDPDRTLDTVLATHPEIRSARIAVDRANASVRRAQVEWIPNLTVSSGYVYQGQNKSDDWLLGVSAPIPVWNRNQGNIRALKAESAMAGQDVGRVENELAERVAVALRSYSAAVTLAEQYRDEILPKAEETYKLSREAFKGLPFEYLRVIQAQRTVAEARLEYNRALGEAWRAAAELSGLLLEEWWPGPPPVRGPK